MIINEIYNLLNNDLNKKINNFLNLLNTKIRYGYIDKNNKIYKESELNSQEWLDNYELQINDRLLTTKIGHCWDFVELERWFFNNLNIKNETYFICDLNLTITHTILVYFLNNKVYYFESAWFKNKGIYEFDSIEEFWNYFTPLYSKSNNLKKKLHKYYYSKPQYPMNQHEFIIHCTTHYIIK